MEVTKGRMGHKGIKKLPISLFDDDDDIIIIINHHTDFKVVVIVSEVSRLQNPRHIYTV